MKKPDGILHFFKQNWNFVTQVVSLTSYLGDEKWWVRNGEIENMSHAEFYTEIDSKSYLRISPLEDTSKYMKCLIIDKH